MKKAQIKKTTDLKEMRAEVEKQFADFAIEENLPNQGQNQYCANLLLNKGVEKYLLKTILLERVAKNNLIQVDDELDVYKKMRSPYVVKLIDYKKTDKYVFLLFPFLPGNNLEHYRHQKKLSEEEIKAIGKDIARGISDFYNPHRIIHQDLKPANIMIGNDSEVTILDFGSVRYGKSPFKGTTKTNYKYSSPEQIKASRPGNIEELKISLSDKSDVFSLGIMLYELVEGQHPFFQEGGSIPDSILDGIKIPTIHRKDISEDFKKFIYRMLEYSTVHRPSAQEVQTYIEGGSFPMVIPPKGNLYYFITTGQSNTGRFIEYSEGNSGLFDGVVIKASEWPKKMEHKLGLRSNAKTLIVDPETYLFQRAASHHSKNFKKLPYYKYRNIVEDGNKFYQFISNGDASVQQFVNDVMDYQDEKGAHYIIPPFFCIQDFTDKYWDIDLELTRMYKDVASKKGKPILKGVAISEDFFESETSLEKMLEHLMCMYDVDGFYLLLEASFNDVIKKEDWLKSANNFFTKLLSTGKSVIWARADISGLLFSSSGISITTGEYGTQRMFDFSSEPSTGGRKVPYYYAPEMFARIKWPEAVEVLRDYYAEYGELIKCPSDCCDKEDFKNLGKRLERDLALHQLKSFRFQWDKYSKNKIALVEDINRAKKYYTDMHGHTNTLVQKALEKDIRPSLPHFLESWLNIVSSS